MSRGGIGGIIMAESTYHKRTREEVYALLGKATATKLLVLTALDVVAWGVGYFWLWSWDFSDFEDADVDGYGIQTSLVDTWITSLVKLCVIWVSFVHFPAIEFSFWFVGLVFFLDMAKLIMFDAWDDAGASVLVCSQVVVTLLELLYVKRLRNAELGFTKFAKQEEGAESVAKGEGDAVELEALTAEGKGAETEEKDKAKKKKRSFNGKQMMRILKPYFWPDGWRNRCRIFATWFFLLASKVSNVLGPLFIGQAASDLEAGIVPYAPIILYASLSFGSKAFKEIQQVVYQKVKQVAFAQLSEYTFRHLHGLSLDWHLAKKMGNVLRSMDRGVSSADTVVTYLFLYLTPAIAECLVVFFIFYFHFNIPWLTTIAFLSLTAYVVVTVKLTLWRKKFRAKTNKHDNDYHDKITDSLTNYETVKYFANEDYEANSFRESIDKFQSYSVDTQMSLSLLNTSQSFIIRFCIGAALVMTAHEIVNGDGSQSLGDFVAINVYLLQLFTPLMFLGTVYGAIIQSFVDMENLSELLAVEVGVADHPRAKALKFKDPSCATVEFRDVSFHYPSQNSKQGIHNVSFTVPAGTTTAFCGTTGAGKTTIGRLLFRVYDVKEGAVLIDGQDIRDVTQLSLRKGFGVVPQDTVMFNSTIKHNIQYGNLDAPWEEVVNAARQAQILPFIERLDGQWDSVVGERGLKLSGGEKQRVAVARALLKNPPICLLDEATSALDSVTEAAIQKSLVALSDKRTTIVIAHRLSTIRHADQIIVLDHGSILEKGTHAALLENKGKYWEMWESQLSELREEKKHEMEAKTAAAAEEGAVQTNGDGAHANGEGNGVKTNGIRVHLLEDSEEEEPTEGKTAAP
jgi:ABC-type transport system involved in Fe-S cluster assembly fused permease/ATPase subunit